MERLERKFRRREMITVTDDFSCYDKKGESEDMAKLKNLAQRGFIDMKGTEYTDKEYESSPASVRAKLRQQVESFQKL